MTSNFHYSLFHHLIVHIYENISSQNLILSLISKLLLNGHKKKTQCAKICRKSQNFTLSEKEKGWNTFCNSATKKLSFLQLQLINAACQKIHVDYIQRTDNLQHFYPTIIIEKKKKKRVLFQRSKSARVRRKKYVQVKFSTLE